VEIDIKVSHQDIKAYLLGDIDKPASKNVLEMRKKEPVYNLFFEVIDKVSGLVDIPKSRAHLDTQMSFEAMEEIIIDILGGQIQPEVAQQFINELMHSEVSYERLLMKLSQIAPLLGQEKIPEMAEVRIKSADELLTRAGITTGEKVDPAKRSQPEIRERLHWILAFPKNIPKYAFVFPVLLAVALATFLVFNNLKENKFSEYYVYDDQVPYKFDVSSLRRSLDSSGQDSLVQSFVRGFRFGMSKYVRRDYHSAIHLLETLRTPASQLQAHSPDQELWAWIRDLYFYLGVSHFALSRKEGLSEQEMEPHSEQAIQLLSRAETLINQSGLDNPDRETYFLGLAYGMGGGIDSALVKLRKIKPESDFFKDGTRLIQELSKQ